MIIGSTDKTSVPDTMLFYDVEKGALRFGEIETSNWQQDSLGQFSFAFGNDVKATGTASVAGGELNQASGYASTAFGSDTEASGEYAVALGNYTEASGSRSIATGYYSNASSAYAVAMGYFSVASGIASISLGTGTKAFGDYAVAMGDNTRASGRGSAAFASYTEAAGDYTVAMGLFTQANGFASTVVGAYNDTLVSTQTTSSPSTPLFIVGNGASSNDRSNALVVRKNGKVEIEGALQVGVGGTEINEMQSGTGTIGTNGSGGVKSATILFDSVFSSTPRVVCTVRAGNFVDTFVVCTRAINTASFTVNVYRVDNGGGNWGQSLQLDWIATN